MLIFNNYLGMPTQQEREKDFPPNTHLQRQLLEGILAVITLPHNNLQ